MISLAAVWKLDVKKNSHGCGDAVRTKMMGWQLVEGHGWALQICKTDRIGSVVVDERE